LAGRGLEFRVDATNADVSIPRNRIRHEVLPALERVSDGATRAIARAARLAEDDDDFLGANVIEALPRIVLSSEGIVPGSSVHLDRSGLRALHPAVARRVLRHVASQIAPGRFFALTHIDTLLELTSGTLDLPGISAEAGLRGEQAILRIGPAGFAGRQYLGAGANVFRYSLSIPGEVYVPELDIVVAAELPGGEAGAGPDGVRVRAAAIPSGLEVRNRKPGDRFRPVGLGGSKKLQDYFVDRKVPRSERDRVPLVVDDRDRIVWVVGHTIAEEFSPTASPAGAAEPVLLLKVRHLGESV
jgi:tRNA(Ile)-lysidine synthase